MDVVIVLIYRGWGGVVLVIPPLVFILCMGMHNWFNIVVPVGIMLLITGALLGIAGFKLAQRPGGENADYMEDALFFIPVIGWAALFIMGGCLYAYAETKWAMHRNDAFNDTAKLSELIEKKGLRDPEVLQRFTESVNKAGYNEPDDLVIALKSTTIPTKFRVAKRKSYMFGQSKSADESADLEISDTAPNGGAIEVCFPKYDHKQDGYQIYSQPDAKKLTEKLCSVIAKEGLDGDNVQPALLETFSDKNAFNGAFKGLTMEKLTQAFETQLGNEYAVKECEPWDFKKQRENIAGCTCLQIKKSGQILRVLINSGGSLVGYEFDITQ